MLVDEVDSAAVRSIEAVEKGYGIKLTESQSDLVRAPLLLGVVLDTIEEKYGPLSRNVRMGAAVVLSFLTESTKKVIADAHGKDYNEDWSGDKGDHKDIIKEFLDKA